MPIRQQTGGKRKSGKKGGGGGGGKMAKPNVGGGLYSGRGGDIAAQALPQNYFTTQAAKAHMGPTTGTSYDDWLNTSGYGQVYDNGYQNALAGNEKLMFKDYLNKAGGSSLGNQLTQGYQHWAANTEPQTHWAGQLVNRGMMPGSGSGSEHQRFLAGDYYAQKYGEFEGQRQAGDATLGWDEFLNGDRYAPGEVFTGVGSYGSSGGGGGKGKGGGGKKKKGGR